MLEESLQVRIPDGEVEACAAVEPALGREDLAGQTAVFDFAVDDVVAGSPGRAHDAERRSAKRERPERCFLSGNSHVEFHSAAGRCLCGGAGSRSGNGGNDRREVNPVEGKRPGYSGRRLRRQRKVHYAACLGAVYRKTQLVEPTRVRFPPALGGEVHFLWGFCAGEIFGGPCGGGNIGKGAGGGK